MRAGTIIAAILAAILAAGCATRSPPCDPQQGWNQALAGSVLEAGCEHQSLWREATRLGARYRALSDEFEQLNGIPVAARSGSQRIELVRLERDLNSVRGAAQVRGWLPPTELP